MPAMQKHGVQTRVVTAINGASAASVSAESVPSQRGVAVVQECAPRSQPPKACVSSGASLLLCDGTPMQARCGQSRALSRSDGSGNALRAACRSIAVAGRKRNRRRSAASAGRRGGAVRRRVKGMFGQKVRPSYQALEFLALFWHCL
jgi:hypothetical protein